MNRFLCFSLTLVGSASIAYAECSQGAVICKLSDNKRPLKPAHLESFGCQPGGLLNMGCKPIESQLTNAQNNCVREYGGIDGQVQCF